MSTNSPALHQTHWGVSRLKRVAERMFQGYTGNLSIRLWDGTAIVLGRGSPLATLVVNTRKLLRDLAWRPDPLRLAEAYFVGEIAIEGDLYALLMQRAHLQSITLSLRDRLALFSAALFPGGDSAPVHRGKAPLQGSKRLPARVSRRHSKRLTRDAIAFHYDVSNEFYRLFLDQEMVYSCAYFNDPRETLDQAQRNKLDHICRKLRLRAGERLLDIGCGWGALICWAAQHYGARAHGITLSREQYEYTKAKIRTCGIGERVTVELQDYRDLPHDAPFDKVASIGMFEHVGLKNLPLYFRVVRRVLKPGGLFLNHGITDNEGDRGNAVGIEFIRRYVFPDGELEGVSQVQAVMEQAGFEISDVEALRAHYALTLRRWVARLEARRDEALAYVSAAKYRVWRLYMAACALQFEQGALGVYQILATNPREGFSDVPLTRADIYRLNRPSTV